MKPHAIITLNKLNTIAQADQWNVSNATACLLNSVNTKINNNENYMKYAEKWRKTSAFEIESMRGLLQCYYSTANVVCLPEKSYSVNSVNNCTKF